MTDDFKATFDSIDITEYVNRENVQRAIEAAGYEAARKIYEQWMAALGVTPLEMTVQMRQLTDDELAGIALVYAEGEDDDTNSDN